MPTRAGLICCWCWRPTFRAASNETKFKLQREGYASAILDPRVLRAISDGEHRRIGVIFIEWASEFEQKVIVDWTVVANERDAKRPLRPHPGGAAPVLGPHIDQRCHRLRGEARWSAVRSCRTGA